MDKTPACELCTTDIVEVKPNKDLSCLVISNTIFSRKIFKS